MPVFNWLFFIFVSSFFVLFAFFHFLLFLLSIPSFFTFPFLYLLIFVFLCHLSFFPFLLHRLSLFPLSLLSFTIFPPLFIFFILSYSFHSITYSFTFLPLSLVQLFIHISHRLSSFLISFFSFLYPILPFTYFTLFSPFTCRTFPPLPLSSISLLLFSSIASSSFPIAHPVFTILRYRQFLFSYRLSPHSPFLYHLFLFFLSLIHSFLFFSIANSSFLITILGLIIYPLSFISTYHLFLFPYQLSPLFHFCWSPFSLLSSPIPSLFFVSLVFFLCPYHLSPLFHLPLSSSLLSLSPLFYFLLSLVPFPFQQTTVCISIAPRQHSIPPEASRKYSLVYLPR